MLETLLESLKKPLFRYCSALSSLAFSRVCSFARNVSGAISPPWRRRGRHHCGRVLVLFSQRKLGKHTRNLAGGPPSRTLTSPLFSPLSSLRRCSLISPLSELVAASFSGQKKPCGDGAVGSLLWDLDLGFWIWVLCSTTAWLALDLAFLRSSDLLLLRC